MGKQDEYIKKMKCQLDEWNKKLHTLEEKAAKTKDKYADEIATVKRRRDEAKQKLSEIQSAGAEAWSEMKTGMDAAWDILKEAFEKARAKFD